MILTDEEYAALDVRSEAKRAGIAALLLHIDIELPATAKYCLT
jgi:hypothetical protein